MPIQPTTMSPSPAAGAGSGDEPNGTLQRRSTLPQPHGQQQSQPGGAPAQHQQQGWYGNEYDGRGYRYPTLGHQGPRYSHYHDEESKTYKPEHAVWPAASEGAVFGGGGGILHAAKLVVIACALAGIMHYAGHSSAFNASAVAPRDSAKSAKRDGGANLRSAAPQATQQMDGMMQGQNGAMQSQNNGMMGQNRMMQQQPNMVIPQQGMVMPHSYGMMMQSQNGMMIPQQQQNGLMPHQGTMMQQPMTQQPMMVPGPNGMMMMMMPQQPNVMMPNGMVAQQPGVMVASADAQQAEGSSSKPENENSAAPADQGATADEAADKREEAPAAATEMSDSESGNAEGAAAEGGAEAAGIESGSEGTKTEGKEAQEGEAAAGATEAEAAEAKEGEAAAADTGSTDGTPTDGGPPPAELANIELKELSNFKDAWEPWDKTDVPIFLHIPKAGGSTVKDVIGTCHRFVMATEFGITDGHADDEEIAVVYPGGGPKGQDRSPFVNVDTTTIAGIQRAKEMGFADSGLADAVVTPFIYEANELFTPTAKGRLFTVFRHPIDRAISMFYYIQVADWEPSYAPELKDWTIEQYAKSDKIENNWLTRQLANKNEGDLSNDDMKLAMEVLRRKFLVGLMTEIETTMERFERFFRWTYHVNPLNQEKCRETLLGGGSNKNTKKKKVEEGSEAWELLAHQNNYDLQLYEYIESLFKEQEQFVADIPEGFRNIDATCCKCGPPTYPPEGFTCPLAILN